MSQTPEEPLDENNGTEEISQTTTRSPEEFLAEANAARRHNVARGADGGPRYCPQGNPTLWHNQIFFEGKTPEGTISPDRALRAGSSQNGVDLALVGSPQNTEDVVCAADSTITISFEHSDSADGEFTEAGPTICFTAPEAGMKAGPGETLCRLPLVVSPLPWIKCKVVFSGTISGGLLDCGLVYTPR